MAAWGHDFALLDEVDAPGAVVRAIKAERPEPTLKRT
jgi:hypothetical protein